MVGEALIDLVVLPDGSVSAHCGGGPYNTARTLGRLGVPVSYLGRLSTDAFGRRLGAALAADGVGLDLVVSTEDPTTLAVAELDERGSATYRFYLEGTSMPGLTPTEAVGVLPAEAAALHVGTLGLVLEPVATAAEAVLGTMSARGSLVFVDPNIRPRVIAERAEYLARLVRFTARADVVKVSDEDLAWIAPGVDPVEAARSLGAPVVLVTCGGDGVVILAEGAEERVPAPSVAVVDTIGAGDSFSGGVLAWWWANGRPPLLGAAVVEAVRYAVGVAAITCTRAGAEPPYPAELAGLARFDGLAPHDGSAQPG